MCCNLAGDASQEGYTLSIGEPVVVSDFADERRLRPSPLVTAHGAVSGISVVIRQDDHPYGVLAAFTTRRRDFSEDDVRFMRGIANTLGLALQTTFVNPYGQPGRTHSVGRSEGSRGEAGAQGTRPRLRFATR